MKGKKVKGCNMFRYSATAIKTVVEGLKRPTVVSSSTNAKGSVMKIVRALYCMLPCLKLWLVVVLWTKRKG